MLLRYIHWGGVDFVAKNCAQSLASDPVPRFGGAAEDGRGAQGMVNNVFGLWRDAELVFYPLLFEEIVKRSHPYVPKQDKGRLEHRDDGAGVVDAHDARLGAEGSGFTGAKASAEPENQVLSVVDKRFLGWE